MNVLFKLSTVQSKGLLYVLFIGGFLIVPLPRHVVPTATFTIKTNFLPFFFCGFEYAAAYEKLDEK